jgi:putative Mg2+ transporter-C (MgtC) family protein
MNGLEYGEVFLRLSAAVVVGALIGLDRELRGKPAGFRTVALVSLGSAMFVLTAASGVRTDSFDPVSRAIQGIVTGVGFLGAGTIVRGQTQDSVKGLTTAASVWLAAATGIACGLAQWALVITASVFGLLVLAFEPVEAWIKRHFAK